jgi:hypothetical protein
MAAPKDLWLKTPFANLIRYVPSGIYFSRIRVQGKLIRRSLKTNKLAIAKLGLTGCGHGRSCVGLPLIAGMLARRMTFENPSRML